MLVLVEYELEVLHSLLVDRFTFCTTACSMSFGLASVSGGMRQHGDSLGGGTFYYSCSPDESLLLLGTSCVPSAFVVLCNDLDLSQWFFYSARSGFVLEGEQRRFNLEPDMSFG